VSVGRCFFAAFFSSVKRKKRRKKEKLKIIKEAMHIA
jgi:hypothetical protein